MKAKIFLAAILMMVLAIGTVNASPLAPKAATATGLHNGKQVHHHHRRHHHHHHMMHH